MDAGKELARLRLGIRGVVQGVGFRPFVHRLAVAWGLSGWVRNGSRGVTLEAEGDRGSVEAFLDRISTEAPAHSRIQQLEPVWIPPRGDRGFEIVESDAREVGDGVTFVVPDIATCADCLREVFDPADRRYRYPFTNCTHCGPRYSILEALPYDRARTSMRGFRMCARCQAEYDDPRDRRFHAQPNACPECGPRLEFRDVRGGVSVDGEAAIGRAVELVRAGRILAVKGIGGFHLWVSAHDAAAVRELRRRKRRGAKPFALMFPSLERVREACQVSVEEERLLASPAAPIVLLRRRVEAGDGLVPPGAVADGVAPRNPHLGAMLPYSPLHHLLMRELGFAVVATSGNLGDEPICTEVPEALERLREVADGFLVHDRPIVRPLDDSIVRIMADRPVALRRARGYAPAAIGLDGVLGEEGTVGRPFGSGAGAGVLGVGAHLKNAVALSDGRDVHLGPHVGDLENAASVEVFRRSAEDLQRMFRIVPSRVAVDGHPDYESTRFGRRSGWPVVVVQHHYAHVLACMAENGVPPPALGVVWDGTGDGMDGTVWGGEFLRVTEVGFERVGRFRPFRLPGGEAGVREPRRAAVGVLYGLYGDEAFVRSGLPPMQAFPTKERSVLAAMLARGLNSPWTSSVGRLFDAVASVCDLRQVSEFEGDAAMSVEFAAEGVERGRDYPIALVPWEASGGGGFRFEVDWGPMFDGVVKDREAGVEVSGVVAGFHEALEEVIVAAATRIGERRVVLSGGCFQNRRLTEGALRRLRAAGFLPVWPRWVPPNDGGIALGQVVAALREAR